MSENICPNCGNKNPESQFCLNCGMPLTEQARKSPKQRAIAQQAQEQFNMPLCILICCCLTPIGGLIYYFIAKSE
jgi:uncharacterized membrane protein YvbJ